jgi:hypothetical protein
MLFTSIARKPYQCSMSCKTPLLRVTSKTSSSSSAAADIVGILLDGKGPAGTGAVMLGGVASAGAVAMAGMVGVLRVASVAKVAVTVVAEGLINKRRPLRLLRSPENGVIGHDKRDLVRRFGTQWVLARFGS